MPGRCTTRRRHGRRALLFAAVSLLPGCRSLLTEGTADLAGVAGAGIAGAVTSSAVGGAAIGLGIRSLAREGLRYTERRVHRAAQDAVATAAGPLAPGTVAPWAVRHSLPLEADAAGEVTVSRVLEAGSFRCKEIVFSVDTRDRGGPRRAFYTATVCQDAPETGGVWRWASAEPSVDRWGGLQ